ncbi:MAG: GGDEF domain-containing protein [Lachnospiraceae bacterium]|nr:GGDEF domain-containing protein [Lachnospiraceae bacterium]
MKKRGCLLLTAILIAVTFFMGDRIQVNATQELSGHLEILLNVSEEDMAKYLEGFQKKYPNVTLEYHAYGDYENEIKERIESGDYGDVLLIPTYIPYDQVGTYFRALGEYNKLDEKYLYMQNAIYSGKIVYGIPSFAYTSGILYNKDVFYQAGISEPPKSIEDFLIALQSIKERTEAIPFYTNYASEWALPIWESFSYIEMTGNPDYKENLLIKEKDPFLKGSAHYEVYELLYDIVELGMCEEDLKKITWDRSKKMLNRGEIGCVAIGSWAVSQFKAAGPNSDAIAFMPFPNEIEGRQYMTISTDYNYGVSRNSENPDAAKAFVSYMLDESGFALDHETISIVRTDPYPASYGDMEDVLLLCNNLSVGDNYLTKQVLSAGLNLENGQEIKRVIEAAKGSRPETFEDIAQEWNSKWEANRTPDMPVEEEKVTALYESVIIDSYEVSFSQTESDYLEEKQLLRVGYVRNMPPFQYEEEGGFTGLASYMCDMIGESTGLSVTYVPYDNTQEMIAALSENDIDMIACIDVDADYGEDLNFSKEYLSSMNVLVRNEALAVAELESSMSAYVEGEEVGSHTAEVHSLGKRYATYEEAIASIETDASSWTIMNYYTAEYYVQELDCKNISVMPLSGGVELGFAFAKDVDTRLISICNKCIYGMPEENLQIVLRDYMEPGRKPITLKRFIEENPIPCIIVLLGIFLLIAVTFVTVILEKYRSARKQALDAQRYELLTSLIDEYIIGYDYATEVFFFDNKLQERFAISKNIRFSDDGYENDNVGQILRNYQAALKEGKEVTQAFRMTDIEGNKQWYRLLFRVIYKNDGTPQSVIGKICNVQKTVEELQQAEDRAQRDALTGIYNRKGFDKQLGLLQENTENYLPATLAVIDLDDFKGVNDTLGHAGGDAVLQLLVGKLQNIFDENTISARFGGDEFMMYIYGQEMASVEELLGRLVKEMDMSFTYHNISRKISVSVGAAYTESKKAFEEMFEVADKALYETKELGRNGYVLREILR